ncbi:hypothetical protein NKH48_13755 [Mesorhizobium sp. M1233]|uniref:hypothetical protein n=1 Tax=Mesorhizobium sp. M1233 TaxID=2957072 RepID=UPI003337AED7
MTRHLDLTQRQVRAICEGAKRAGYAPIIQVGNMLVRLVPENHAILPQASKPIDADVSPEAFDTLDEYLAWRDRSGAGGA